ncbi:MAG: DUF2029 domain-containing protein [Thermoflexales bacterium]|nr:DUF2029 domain-containing protein [Thermoflexales bacterium]MDW8351557.1 glycosyltransferase family 87 protein [Anaerolineae bacterium]
MLQRRIASFVRARITFAGALFIACYVAAGLYTELRLIEGKPLPQMLLEDFAHYERALKDALSGIGAYAVREIGPGFLYPPPSLFLVEAFQFASQTALKAALYWTLNVSLLTLVVLAVVRRFDGTPVQHGYWLALSLAFAPFLELLHIGQINVITLFGIALVFLYQDRSAVLTGLGLALAVITKLSPLVLAAYLLARKKFDAVMVCAALLAAALVLSALRYDASLLDYAATVRWLSEQFPLGNNSHSFVSKLRALGMPLRSDPYLAPLARVLINFRLAQPLLSVLPIALIVGASLLLLLRKGGAGEPAFAITVLGMALVPNVMWYHHYVFLLLPLLIWAGWRRFDWRVVAWCGIGLLIAQVDRFHLTHGLLVHLFGRLTMLVILYQQVMAVTPQLQPVSADS